MDIDPFREANVLIYDHEGPGGDWPVLPVSRSGLFMLFLVLAFANYVVIPAMDLLFWLKGDKPPKPTFTGI